MGYLVFFLLLFATAAMILNPAGRRILLVMFLIVAIPVGIISLIVIGNEKASEKAAPVVASETAPVEGTMSANAGTPPAPDLQQVEDGVDTLESTVADKGFAGAVAITMKCYSDMQVTRSWGSWDRCAALDEYALKKFDPSGWQTGAGYFSRASVEGRETTAISLLSSDFNANKDRVSAIQGIVDQAIASIPLRAAARWAKENPSATTIADSGSASPPTAAPAPLHPSFDCTRVQSQTLKLVCSTPTLTKADNDLADAYRLAMEKTADRAGLVASQAQWIKFRNAGAADVDTMSASYLARTRELRVVAGLETPAQPYEPHTAGHLSLEPPTAR